MINEELLDELKKITPNTNVLHSELYMKMHNPFFSIDLIPELEQIATKIDFWENEQNGTMYYMWDTKTLTTKILEDAKEECGYSDNFVRMAYFSALYLKCFAPYEIKLFIKEYYDTGKKNYNTVIEGETMYKRMYMSELPYIASLIWVINDNNKYFRPNPEIYFDTAKMHCDIHIKKPSEDGLKLIECDENEAHNLAMGTNPYLNMDDETYEKIKKEKYAKLDEIDKKIEELLYERRSVQNRYEHP